MPTVPRTRPPKKQNGQGLGPRRIDGAVLDVRTAATFLGVSEKTLRGQVERRLIPFRRWNGRIVLVRQELEEFVMTLDGCTVEEVQENMRIRQGADA
jgi:Helix-turn-helix domain